MTKVNRILLFIIYTCTGILSESLVSYLFPYTGLGGLICYPTSIALSLLFGGTLYMLGKSSVKPLLVGLTFFAFISVQFLFELYVHPQDFGGSTFKQIAEYKQAFKKFDNISFDSFPVLNKAERIAYIYKFKNRLPSTISTLSIDSSSDQFITEVSRKYILLNYPRDTTYDTTVLKLKHTDTSLVIIENPHDSSKMNVHVADKYLLKNTGGGVIDTGKSISYNVWLDDLKLHTGLEKLVYRYLTMTKASTK
jgi:hypothetical protein